MAASDDNPLFVSGIRGRMYYLCGGYAIILVLLTISLIMDGHYEAAAFWFVVFAGMLLFELSVGTFKFYENKVTHYRFGRLKRVITYSDLESCRVGRLKNQFSGMSVKTKDGKVIRIGTDVRSPALGVDLYTWLGNRIAVAKAV